MEADDSTREHEATAHREGVHGGLPLCAGLDPKSAAVRRGPPRRQCGVVAARLGLGLFRGGHVHDGCRSAVARQGAVALAGMLALGCPTSNEAPAPEPAPQKGRLSIDLPPGVAVWVDGVERGVTPLPPFELSAAAHALTMRTSCDEVDQTVVIQPGTRTTVDRDAVSGLAFASLDVTAKTIRDLPLDVKLHLDEAAVPPTGNAFVIPACKARMRIEPTGINAYHLGSFIEDIEPKPGETLTRDLVLRPGPDVVRVHGGPFRQGPHPSDDFEHPRTPLEPKRVQVKTFDMDKTEVTARQYMECLGEKRCERDPGHVLYDGSCVFELHDLSGTDATVYGRRMIEGKEDLPANCVNIIEAKSFCEWRGMRLPTPLQFDYAFRSRKSEYAFPWGTDDSQCRAFGWEDEACLDKLEFHGVESGPTYEGVLWRFNPQPACSFLDGAATSEQGICDLAGNLLEFAVFGEEFENEAKHYAMGHDRGWTVGSFSLSGSLPGDAGLGFRCVAEGGDP